MTITFRTDIGIYTGKGSPLTKVEVDTNFYDLLTRLEVVEDGGAFSVESVDYTGTSITFNWSDDTSSGPFVLPVAMMTSRGEWLNSQTYFYLDLVTVTGTGTFLVLQEHTTEAFPTAFDASLEIGGDPVYQQIGESVDVTACLKYRGAFAGTTAYFLNDVFTSATYGTFAVLIGHTSASTFDPLAVSSSDDPLYKQLAGPAFAQVTSSSEITYDVTTADAGKYLRFDSGCIVTFPEDVEFPAGCEIHFRQTGNESIQFVGEGTVLLNPQRAGFFTYTPWEGATVTAKYISLNEWDLIGPHGDEMS